MPKLRPPGGRSAAAKVKEPEDIENHDVEAIEPEPELEEVPEVEDPTIALKAQIEALEKSQREANSRAAKAAQERDEAINRAREREAEVTSLREQTTNSQTEAIEAALAGAEAEAAAAQQEIEMADQLGDAAAKAKAYRKLARAEASILTLENGKAALEKQIKEAPKQEPQQQGDALDRTNLPPLAKQWLRNNPEYLYDARKNAKLQAMHWDVVDEGYEPYSSEYYEVMEQRLGKRQAPVVEKEVEEEQPPVSRRGIVSAPVSRETPTSSGSRESRVTLTPAQKEAAKNSGIDEKTYAEMVMRLRKAKSEGNYGGGQ